MKLLRHSCPTKCAGYSLVEMMMTLAVGLILVSVALPTMIGAIQGYRLNSIAQQVATLVELTRYTAIRRNSVVILQMKVIKGNTVFFIDLNGNGQPDANEPMVILPTDMQLANGQTLTPPSTSMALGNTIDFASSMTFDYRGMLNYTNGVTPAPYFLALGYTSQAQYGTRAVTVTPIGQTKTWKAPSGGTWSGM
jgi:prepilin-type N-terminal cleavage/methylation domain-containing protein